MSPTTPRPTAETDRSHRFPIRVYYEDTDAAGIVYHAQYLCFMERARTEFMRALGMDHSRLLDEHGCVFTVRRLTLDFVRPARLDDLLEVVSTVRQVAGARLLIDQAVCRDDDVMAKAELQLAIVGRELRPRRLPPALAAVFDAWSVA
jgi:acyl-CoA thioester hydrolase